MKNFLVFIFALIVIAASSVAAVFSYLNYNKTDKVTVDITDNITKALITGATEISESELDYLITLNNDVTDEDVDTLPETGVKTSTTVKVIPTRTQYPRTIACAVYQYNGSNLSYISTYRCNPMPPLVKTSAIATPTVNPDKYGQTIQAEDRVAKVAPMRTMNMMLAKTNTVVSCFMGTKLVKTEYYDVMSIDIKRYIKKITYEICIKGGSDFITN
jgi:hypothetical protein